MTRTLTDTLIEHLRACVGHEQVLSSPEELLVYECDGLPQHKHPPRAVLFPRSTEEVSEAVRVLAREGVHFAPRGAGTGLSGGAVSLNRGVIIELARMRRVLKVDVENRLAVVQPGVVNAQLSRAVAPLGLHYAPDPSSQAACTVGGNIAENAGGIHCLKYGVTTDHVLGVRVVLSDGSVVDLGGAGGEAAGYDLLGVFVGSEGTFGIATEATVRLTPLPQAVRTLLADFTDINDASRAVTAIIAGGIIPAALEMVDGATIRAVEASVFAAGLPLDAEAALLVELDGLEAGLDAETARVEALCRANGARGCRRAADEAERKKLWAARKGAFGAMGRLAPDVMIQDAVVPRSRLPEVLAETYRVGAKYRLRLANVFHAGDGNLHPFISFDSRDPEEARRVKEAGRELMETCVRAGGTITGEHGVGFDKSEYLPLIFDEETIGAMLRVRAAFDPLGICNPGKIIPAPRGCGEARAVAEGKKQKAEGRRQAAGGEAQTPGSENEVAPRESPAPRMPFAPANAFAPLPSLSGQPRGAFDPERTSALLSSVVGAEHVAAGAGEFGAVTASPASVEEAVEVLRVAASEGWKVVPCGAGLWLDAGHTPPRACVVVKTARMSRVIEHEPSDLVATVQAGATLARLNEGLSSQGQWLPLDPPDDGRATVGGVAATGLSGAQRLGYGAPRGHVLGMRLALADGRLIRVGSRVVKNVAGYDLCKLFTGSYGTLGMILELTLKLRPRPAREATLLTRGADASALLRAARALLAEQLQPVAVELLSPRAAASVITDGAANRAALLLRFAGVEEAVAYQTERAGVFLGEQLRGCEVEPVSPDAGLWSNLASLPVRAGFPLAWRAGVRPSELEAMLAEVGREGRGGDSMWQAGVGDGRLRVFEGEVDESIADRAQRLGRLREAARSAGGGLVIERVPVETKQAIDVWGVAPQTAALMRRVKEQLDPEGMFSPGRFMGEEGLV